MKGYLTICEMVGEFIGVVLGPILREERLLYDTLPTIYLLLSVKTVY